MKKGPIHRNIMMNLENKNFCVERKKNVNRKYIEKIVEIGLGEVFSARQKKNEIVTSI